MKDYKILAFSDKMSKINRDNLVIFLNKDRPSEIFLDVHDHNATVTRQADFTEILFHELCHVMHYMFVGLDQYKGRYKSQTCIIATLNKVSVPAWKNDEELYTVTGLSIDDSTGKISYNPINENAFANELGLSIREIYDGSKSIYCSDKLNKIYEEIGFFF